MAWLLAAGWPVDQIAQAVGAPALAKLLDDWAQLNPTPYLGPHWP